jgi:hypothetical protein
MFDNLNLRHALLLGGDKFTPQVEPEMGNRVFFLSDYN